MVYTVLASAATLYCGGKWEAARPGVLVGTGPSSCRRVGRATAAGSPSPWSRSWLLEEGCFPKEIPVQSAGRSPPLSPALS